MLCFFKAVFIMVNVEVFNTQFLFMNQQSGKEYPEASLPRLVDRHIKRIF